jgi:hypothetical protein
MANLQAIESLVTANFWLLFQILQAARLCQPPAQASDEFNAVAKVGFHPMSQPFLMA